MKNRNNRNPNIQMTRYDKLFVRNQWHQPNNLLLLIVMIVMKI